MKTLKPLPINFWTQARIVKCIKALKRGGHPLTVRSIWKDRSRKTNAVLLSVLKVRTTGARLYLAALRQLGSWDRALIESGLQVENIRQKKFSWNIKTVSKVLRKLHSADIPINAGNFARDRSHRTQEIIYQCTGYRKTGARIYHISNEYLGDWDHILKLSGFKLSQIRKSGSPCKRDRDQIIHFIRIFNKHKFELNRTAVTKNTHQMKVLMEDTIGYLISGQSVFKAAESVFGNWDTALWKSGLDPSQIRLKSRPRTSSLPIMNYQAEDTIVDGSRRIITYFGDPAESPEERVEKEEKLKGLKKVTKSLNLSDQETIESIYDALTEITHWQSRADLCNQIAFRLDNGVTSATVERLMSCIGAKYIQH